MSPAEWLVLSALPLVAALWAAAAQGGTLTVQVTVAGTCSADSAALPFGTFSAGQASDLPGEASFKVNCTDGTPIRIKLGPGNNWDGSSRGMTASGGPASNDEDVLRYNLYVDEGRNQVWGDGEGGIVGGATREIRSFDSLNGWSQPVYGLIEGSQDVTPGSYSDTVQIDVVIDPAIAGSSS